MRGLYIRQLLYADRVITILNKNNGEIRRNKLAKMSQIV